LERRRGGEEEWRKRERERLEVGKGRVPNHPNGKRACTRRERESKGLYEREREMDVRKRTHARTHALERMML